MKHIIAAVIAISFFCPYFARADSTGSPQANTAQLTASSNPSVPNVSGWTVLSTSRIELRVSDDTVAYIGLEAEYSNPANPREFVRVIRRHIPLIISKRKQQNERLLSEMVVVFYTQKEEQDRLKEVSDKSDPILYVQWRTKKNPRTGNDMQDGDANIWFLRSSGDWLLTHNERIEVEFLSENVGNGEPHNVFSGMKYRVGNAYHIIRVDRNDLIKLFDRVSPKALAVAQGGPALRSFLDLRSFNEEGSEGGK
ncbi:MAG: hypothetical protein Q8R55_01520 [Candidatus Taylorbacteria bacterium]|nr:hypothetical protein [Candidatus Taylorbacteria bacterium]